MHVIAELAGLASLAALASIGVVAFRARRAARALRVEIARVETALERHKQEWYRSRREMAGDIAGLILKREFRNLFQGQNAEDVLLWNFFERKITGFFVDVGAYDGVTFSNTYAFEQMGWRGVLVEADAQAAEACRRNRPRSIVVNAAAGPPESQGTATLHRVGGKPGLEMVSFTRAHPKHLDRCRRDGGVISTIKVPCRTLDDILMEVGADCIDFVSIDVEGAELEVLRGFDLHRHKPCVIVIENAYDGQLIRDYLKARGYRSAVEVEFNEFFVRQGETHPLPL
jgi:FkbM family methyltransferase